jgi:hypothetical protein
MLSRLFEILIELSEEASFPGSLNTTAESESFKGTREFRSIS